MSAARAPTLLGATLTLLAGGALAQSVPLFLGPFIARVFMPETFGLYTQFATVAAAVAVAASLRYEQALPLAQDEGEARSLLALTLRLLALAVLVSAPLAWAMHTAGWLHLPAWLPLAVAATGALQVLMLWANRAQRFQALAVSRVLQYGGAALLQLALGWALWRGVPVGREGAWALVLAPIVAQLLASLCLLRPAPADGWWAVLAPASGALRGHMRAVAYQHRAFAFINTPHAFLGTLQDALAVALLVAWSGDAAAGFWGMALRYLKAPATLVGSAVSQALYPRLAAAAPRQAQRMVRQVMGLLAVPALGLMALLLVAGPWLFERLFGAPWREAGELARALAPYIAAHFVAAPLAVVTMAWRAQAWAFRLALVGQLAFVVALAVGLRQGGLLGGAWAVSAAMVPYFGWYFWRLARWPQGGEPGAPA